MNSRYDHTTPDWNSAHVMKLEAHDKPSLPRFLKDEILLDSAVSKRNTRRMNKHKVEAPGVETPTYETWWLLVSSDFLHRPWWHREKVFDEYVSGFGPQDVLDRVPSRMVFGQAHTAWRSLSAARGAHVVMIVAMVKEGLTLTKAFIQIGVVGLLIEVGCRTRDVCPWVGFLTWIYLLLTTTRCLSRVSSGYM